MDKIKQYQTVTDIKPAYKQLVHPFHKSSPFKIKFMHDEVVLQYDDIGLWSIEDEKIKGKSGGSPSEPSAYVVDLGMFLD